MSALPVPSLHLITDRRRLAPGARTVREEVAALESQVAEAVAAGLDVVQIRERDLAGRVLFELVQRSVRIAEGTGTRILVNERADVAAAARADGVHLPSTGIPADRIRSLVTGDWTVGRSIHGEQRPGDIDACDYLLFGTVYRSASKTPESPVAGPAELRRAVTRAGRPVVAIGGIVPANARACVDAGAVGVAAIGAFLPGGLTGGPADLGAVVSLFRREMGPA